MFPLRRNKMIQAVGLVLGLQANRRMNYTKLIKLLYLADRESIKETGEPITGDTIFALKSGPILSLLTDLVRGKRHSRDWSRYFCTNGHDLVMVSDPGQDSLCDYEHDKLQELNHRYRNYDYSAMIGLTHKLPEYKKNEVTSGRKRIALADVLEALGIADQAEVIEEDARSMAIYQAGL